MLIVIYWTISLEGTGFSNFRLVSNSLGIFSYLGISFLGLKLRKKPEKQNVSVKKCTFFFFGALELGCLYQYVIMKITKIVEGYKVPPGKKVQPKEPIST